MNIKIISQNIANNPKDFTAEEIEKCFEDYANFASKEKRVINVEVPKEIWDADLSIFNWRRNIMGAWMKSITDLVKQLENK